jgi:hypothetical protein
MSKVLTVPTHFNDIGELSEGFLDRVEQDILILYGPVAYEDGAEIEFAVLLADGTPALQGMGLVRAAVDGGADRVPETRYDVVVEQLQLDGHYRVVFERLVLARQAVSDRPPADEVVSVMPDEIEADEDCAPPTDPPQAFADLDAFDDGFGDEDEGEEPETVIAAVDPEALMADAEAHEELPQGVTVQGQAFEGDAPVPAEEDPGEPEKELEMAFEGRLELDSMYAFEHGIAAEPRVGLPVPMPSMAAPPEALPSPPVLRLAEPPQGLTRPSVAPPGEMLFNAEDEVSDVHSTGLFAYEDGLPIPSRPPMPGPDRPRKASSVEAVDLVDVEEQGSDDDEYEEVRLSDFAGTAEEG